MFRLISYTGFIRSCLILMNRACWSLWLNCYKRLPLCLQWEILYLIKYFQVIELQFQILLGDLVHSASWPLNYYFPNMYPVRKSTEGRFDFILINYYLAFKSPVVRHLRSVICLSSLTLCTKHFLSYLNYRIERGWIYWFFCKIGGCSWVKQLKSIQFSSFFFSFAVFCICLTPSPRRNSIYLHLHLSYQ